MARMDRTQSLCSAVNVDIPCATVRFERSEGPFEGAGKLVLESRKAPATKADIETVIDSLKTIALRGQEELSGLVAIYDLTCLPSMTVVPHIVGVVGPFSKEYSPILDKLFLSIAVVLQDSFWSAAARNAVNIILKIAPPKCPFLLTHRRDLAEDFVRTNLKAPEQKPAPAVAAAAEPAHRATASTSAADAAAATKDFRTRLLSIDGLDNCQVGHGTFAEERRDDHQGRRKRSWSPWLRACGWPPWRTSIRTRCPWPRDTSAAMLITAMCISPSTRSRRKSCPRV
eukprot:TRINITY_DN22094_c0_g1_i3.p1 TRINITY_DN22094_c0_g1~~TRINITY_DN22094_c0_g1_i3.p1  ORF type:complete len:285 (+),score=40.20 TRINITY_DN22094_c0_g1_i3:130-984(+)